MYQAPNAPLPIGGVLDSGFRLYRDCLPKTFPLALAIGLAGAVFGYVVAANMISGLTPSVVAQVIAGSTLFGIVGLIVFCAILVRIDGVARGEPMSLGHALARGLRRAPWTFVSVLLFNIFVGAIPLALTLAAAIAGITSPIAIGFVFFFFIVFPGSVIAVWMFFGSFATVVDDLGPLKGLRYSREITRGQWWRTTALLTIIFVVACVVYVALVMVTAVGVIANPEAAALGQSPWYVQFVLSPMLQALVAPLVYSLFLAIYYDLKLRHEGGDLAARIAGTA